MEPIITRENLRFFAYCNDRIVKQPIRGIAISFIGLGDARMMEDETPEGKRFAEQGILFLHPYVNPWAWMNEQAVRFVDELVDLLLASFDLPQDLPIVHLGGSMGGQQALVYTAYAKHIPAACVTNCPVCDLPYHYTERPDLPRTLYSAFGSYPGTLQEALESASPLHLVDRLPKETVYTNFHCTADLAVNKEKHSDPFIALLEKAHTVTYHVIEDRGHCDLSPEAWEAYFNAAMAALK